MRDLGVFSVFINLTVKRFIRKVFEPFVNPKNSLLGPQKVKINPKIKSKSNVKIARNIENESCSTTWVDLKTFLTPTPVPKIAQ